MFADLGRLLLITGAVIFALGLVMVLAGRLPWFGQLPGDIAWQRDNVRVYIPIGSMIVVSVVLTLILNLVARFFR